MITWTIQNLECLTNLNDTQNIVYSIFWQAYATRVADGKTYTSSQNGKTDIIVSSGPFIPYEELTEQILLEWLFNRLSDDKINVENALEKEIDEIINPIKVILTPPWK